MSHFSALTFPTPAALAPAAGWDRARPAGAGADGAFADAAQVFGFTGDGQAASVLAVPPARGDGSAQLEARFLDCLFQRA